MNNHTTGEYSGVAVRSLDMALLEPPINVASNIETLQIIVRPLVFFLAYTLYLIKIRKKNFTSGKFSEAG